MISEAQLKVLFKYWERHGGPNYFTVDRVFPMFGIENNSDNVRQAFILYYGGEDEWKRQVNDFEGKIFEPIENIHNLVDIKYKIYDLSFYIDGPYHPWMKKHPYVDVSVILSPYAKLVWEGKTVTLKDSTDLSTFDFIKKYFPEVDENTEEYEQLKSSFNTYFVYDDEDISGDINSTISNDLETRITKPYAVQIDAIDVDPGKQSDFEPTIKESIFRIKLLINFSDY
jgi:hypothetical protein